MMPPCYKVPILAAARHERGRGHGSVLVALLVQMGAELGCRLEVATRPCMTSEE